ncbi:preQ(1) synthase [Helicobacter suis]|uniref:NADPH-dependent 7-cyano-7-deazaguanine reductase n=1 Tax=Helicobacter suis TaxID=104628 RepID=A0A6J4CX99_9HELI|nr:preQ(1) synthase [Helicobacter suis]BCD45813.1 NADPH-dependent 7-cyano-7-deazaguanine reductase QueF [Helicobacter suis]BCD48259.1 NADPH-dependent 7-cyano-7-deazaguanine reductase QueF [Helicobacter suis]BCD50019.1 NADPH-dependent 7-cyano-7-deazaguanine reductase QueF [Helicobacter suis]BCD51782.1 NADPH-dependent 7-cyano-7-deazaguanine reductase QueF [Helicobacter suis]BCD69981.1 NADPH-dependent 7-cyano-7-deazaguanine reductase QueF [Helicobacter suis]
MQGLSHLGHKTPYIDKYDPSLLEAFDNPHPHLDIFTRLYTEEFTSLCPITSQPDFASLSINYIAHLKMVESKSLKLYLFSFRNEGMFGEDCAGKILNDLVALLKPKYLEVQAKFSKRGSIALEPFVSYAIKDYQTLKQQRLARIY